MGLILTEQEYMALYPERVKDGRTCCECGAANIRTTGTGYICAVCNAMLFVTGNTTPNTINVIENKLHQTGAV